MDTGASNEMQQGSLLPTLPPGQNPWNNVSSPSETQEKSSECQLPLYYNTSDVNQPSNAPSPYPQPQESPASTLPYQSESNRYQQHQPARPSRVNQATPGPYSVNTTWSGHSSPPLQTDRLRHNGRPSSTASKPYAYQSVGGKHSGSAWHRAGYPTPYPAYGNDTHQRKHYGHSDMTPPVSLPRLPTIQSNNNNSLAQHQHTPMLVPNPHYTHNNNGSQAMDVRTSEVSNRDIPLHTVGALQTERNMYSPLPNPQNASYYLPQAPFTPRHPSMVQFPHPMNAGHPGAPPYPVTPPTPAHGKGKNRANKNYQCPRCVKVFRRGDHLKRHLLAVHDHDHPYQCGDCGKGFASVAALLKHAKSLHVGNLAKGLMCLRCQLTFKSLQEIESHANSLHVQEDEIYMQNINTSSKQHSCIACAKTFTSAVHLKKHMQLMHRSKDDSKIFCRECGKSFARIDGLRKHIDKTHNGNPNALPPDDLDDTDNSRQTSFSESDSRGPSADNDESSTPGPSTGNTQWGPITPSQHSDQSSQPTGNTQIVPQPTLYQQRTGVHSQMPPANKFNPTQNIGSNSEHHVSIQAIAPQHTLPPHNNKLGNDKIGQNQYPTPTQSENSLPANPNDLPPISNAVYSDSTPVKEECSKLQTVSEVFSMAMRTLSEYDYDSPEEIPQFLSETMMAQQPMLHTRNGFSTPYQYQTGIGTLPETGVHGPTFAAVQTDTNQVIGNKYNVSSRSQRNFLMRMPPPPGATAVECLPTQPRMAAGVVQEPRQWSLFHQEGGGGVKVPIAITSNGGTTSYSNQTRMQRTNNAQTLKVDGILSGFHQPSSIKSNGSQIENNQKNLLCVLCKTEYDSIDNLMSHVEGVHLKANPHKCCICDKHFAQAGNVKRHIRFVHFRERPFECKKCSCTFDRSTYLQRHMRTHLQWSEENQEFNPLKPCYCPECGKQCMTAHHLRGHMQRKHYAKNKNNYSEFLAKYGYLEALGKGPGALTSQRRRRGRRKKSINAETSNVSDAGEELKANGSGTAPDSSQMPQSSIETNSLSTYCDSRFSSNINANPGLQLNSTAYNKPLHRNILHLSYQQPTTYPAADRKGEPTISKQPGSLSFNATGVGRSFIQPSHAVNSSDSVSNVPCGNFAEDGIENSNNSQESLPAYDSTTYSAKRSLCLKLKKKLLSFRCPCCVLKRFYTLEMLRSHLSLHHRFALKRHVCRKCGASFTKSNLLHMHKVKLHTEHGGMLTNFKNTTNVSVKILANTDASAIDIPTHPGTSFRPQYSMQMYQNNQRSFGAAANQVNFFSYDPNSPAMVPSPNVETMYRNPSHHINTSMPLIQT